MINNQRYEIPAFVVIYGSAVVYDRALVFGNAKQPFLPQLTKWTKLLPLSSYEIIDELCRGNSKRVQIGTSAIVIAIAFLAWVLRPVRKRF